MNCPHCKQPINLGHELGKLKSEAKARASRENGRKGGRPIFTKSIEWSYPSSQNAKDLGFGATGCWTVKRGNHAVNGFPSLQDAREWANTMIEEPWDKLTR